MKSMSFAWIMLPICRCVSKSKKLYTGCFHLIEDGIECSCLSSWFFFVCCKSQGRIRFWLWKYIWNWISWKSESVFKFYKVGSMQNLMTLIHKHLILGVKPTKKTLWHHTRFIISFYLKGDRLHRTITQHV